MNVDTQKLHRAYPLLSFLSENQVTSIDLGVLCVPTEAEQAIIDDLSAKLDKHVLIYKKGYEPSNGHLCRLIKSADLDVSRIEEVSALEKNYFSPDKILAVYEKPLVFTDHNEATH